MGQEPLGDAFRLSTAQFSQMPVRPGAGDRPRERSLPAGDDVKLFDDAVFDLADARRAPTRPLSGVDGHRVVIRAAVPVAHDEIPAAVEVHAVLFAANDETVEQQPVEFDGVPAVLPAFAIVAGES